MREDIGSGVFFKFPHSLRTGCNPCVKRLMESEWFQGVEGHLGNAEKDVSIRGNRKIYARSVIIEWQKFRK